MASGQLRTVLQHLHQLAGEPQAGDPTDAELLERFTAHQEQAAFAALVKRHGPLVLGVCRRVLGNVHDAEDAFQATFLILVRKAGSIRRREALTGWLHEVALRVALRARASATNRRRHEQRAPDMPQKDFLATVVWRDLQPILDEEVQGLPDICRAAFVLCYLEGKTYEQAAGQLGCRPGTISRRLARARELLRTRLSRRGLVLPAGVLAAALSQQTAPAAVPAALIGSTVKTALQGVAGAIPARVAALAEGGLKAMTASKAKIALILLAAAGALFAGAAVLAYSAPAARPEPAGGAKAVPQAGAAGAKAPKPPPGVKGQKPTADPARAELTVSGQVVGADGKPVAGADVVLVGRAKSAARAERYQGAVNNKTLAAGKTDREGKFRLGTTGVSEAAYWQVILAALAPGHGMAQERLSFGPGSLTVRLDLLGERVLHGRLVDLQGQPAAGVKVRLESASGKLPPGKHVYVYRQHAPVASGSWPEPVVSDANGRFRLARVPSGCDLTLDIEAEGGTFARQSLEVNGGATGKEVTLALAPGRVLTGTVTYHDTGKPVADARLRIESWVRFPEGGYHVHEVDAQADANGRYRAVPYDGDSFSVTARPAAGAPYLHGNRTVEKPRGIVLKQEINVSLRRGVLVRGVVKATPSGKPVAGASVSFEPHYRSPFYSRDVRLQKDVTTGADGTFATVVLPGPGHLLVNGPTPDYVHVVILTRDLFGPDVSPNRRYYPDGLVALDLKPDVQTHRVEVTLRRGVPLKGRVLDPDGKAVAAGDLLCRCYVPTGYTLNGPRGVPVREGRFELPGWDSANPDPMYFLCPERGLAGMLQIQGGQGDKEPTVRLQKCGGARIRIVDQAGRPLADSRVTILLPLSPGVSFFDRNGFGGKEATADEAFLESFDRKDFADLRTDADGRLELRGLIPGARHWIIVTRPASVGMVRVPVEVNVESGKVVDLKDVTVNLK